MDKKKSHSAKRPSLTMDKPKAEVETPAQAQMVVEVEEDMVPVNKKTIENLENDTVRVEEAAEKLEEDIEKEVNREEIQVSPPAAASLPEKNETKEVVKEFFRTGGVPPEIPAYSKKDKGKSLLLWVIFVLAVAGLTGSLLMFAVKHKSAGHLTTFFVKPTATPTPEPAATPTPTQSVPRSDIKIQVLNGSGIAGAGSKMKDFLTGKGWTVADVGNANNFDYQESVIYVKPDKEAYLSLLQDDLKDTYAVGTASATLSTDVPFDAQVVVGK